MDFDSFVIAAVTTELSDERAARVLADAVEFRLDGADSPLEALEDYDGELPVIATNRPESEGGDVPDGPDRLATLRSAAADPATAAVDVELAAVERGDAAAVIETARETDTNVIVSAHDFEGTPAPARLDALLADAAEAGDVAKLATTATDPGDVLDLMRATLDATRSGATVATMAMGEPGRHSRAIAPLYGSKIGYGSIRPGRELAPGQFDIETLRGLVSRLGGTED
jgi:3-dehydroquinate dehydratase-1